MSKMMKKKPVIIQPTTKKKVGLVRAIPPMERPVTPANEGRTTMSDGENTLHNLNFSDFQDPLHTGGSELDAVNELFLSQNPNDISSALSAFEDTAKSLVESNSFSLIDLHSYNTLSPHLFAILEQKALPPGIPSLLNGLRFILQGAATLPVQSQPNQLPSPPMEAAAKAKSPRSKHLGPLKPLPEISEKASKAQKPEKIPQKFKKIENFGVLEPICHFTAKTAYKLSATNANDHVFAQDKIVELLLDLISVEHAIETRLYSAATLRNALSSDQAEIQKKLLSSPHFGKIFEGFKIVEPTKPKSLLQFLLQMTSVCRNLLNDNQPSTIDLFIKYNAFTVLLTSLTSNQSNLLSPSSSIELSEVCNPELISLVFRSLTKLCGNPQARASALGHFSPSGFLTLFSLLFQKLQNSDFTAEKKVTATSKSSIIARICYVLADFSAYEESVLEAAAALPEEISFIPDLLNLTNSQNFGNSPNSESLDAESTARVLLVIANLSVESSAASILMLSDCYDHLLNEINFAAKLEKDRRGLNIMCVASNFTFHDHAWCPSALIDALPRAIVSKQLPIIIEALRTICNLALSPNSALSDSKIPELLGLLLRHVESEVVLLSLRALANLVNHAGVRRRFREQGMLKNVLELLDADEIDEMQLEAIAALIVNFGALSETEAREFQGALDEFEIDQSVPVFAALRKFLNEILGADPPGRTSE